MKKNDATDHEKHAKCAAETCLPIKGRRLQPLVEAVWGTAAGPRVAGS